MSLCSNCNKRPKKNHFNAKWCKECSDNFKHRPRHNLNSLQIREVQKRLYKMPGHQIAKEVGISKSSFKRWARDEGIRVVYFNRWKANPELVKQVCSYYEKHGKIETEKRFPNVNLRSIVERYQHNPRQLRWKADQLIELAKMAGIVSMGSQAKFFNRPNANIGSIKSAWHKIFRQSGGSINGLSWNIGKHFIDKNVEPIKTKFWSPRKPCKQLNQGRKVILWVDLEKYCKPNLPLWIKESFHAMANFQRWLYKTDHIKLAIRHLIKTREMKNG